MAALWVRILLISLLVIFMIVGLVSLGFLIYYLIVGRYPQAYWFIAPVVISAVILCFIIPMLIFASQRKSKITLTQHQEYTAMKEKCPNKLTWEDLSISKKLKNDLINKISSLLSIYPKITDEKLKSYLEDTYPKLIDDSLFNPSISDTREFKSNKKIRELEWELTDKSREIERITKEIIFFYTSNVYNNPKDEGRSNVLFLSMNLLELRLRDLRILFEEYTREFDVKCK